MNKALILPIVSLFAIVIKQATGYNFDDAVINQVTDAILSISVLAGIFMHPKNIN